MCDAFVICAVSLSFVTFSVISNVFIKKKSTNLPGKKQRKLYITIKNGKEKWRNIAAAGEANQSVKAQSQAQKPILRTLNCKHGPFRRFQYNFQTLITKLPLRISKINTPSSFDQ